METFGAPAPERRRVDNELARAAQDLRIMLSGFVPWLDRQITHIVYDWEHVMFKYYQDGKYVGFKTYSRSEVFRLLGRTA